MATNFDKSGRGVFEKLEHSSLEYLKETPPAPYKERQGAPFKERSFTSAYEAGRGALDFTRRVSEAVHGRSLDGAQPAPAGGRRRARATDDLVVSATDESQAAGAAGVAGREAAPAALAEGAPLSSPARAGSRPLTFFIASRARRLRLPGARKAEDSYEADDVLLDADGTPIEADGAPARPGSSLASALAGEAAHELKFGIAHAGKSSLKSLARQPEAASDEVVSSQFGGAPSGFDGAAIGETDKVAGQLRPETLRSRASFVANDVMPAGRARRRMARWDSKATVAEGKATTLTWKAERAKYKAAQLDPDSLRGRWLVRRQSRYGKKAERQYARARYFRGEGAGKSGKKGIAGRIMALRRNKAAKTAEVLGWRSMLKAGGGLAALVTCMFALILLLGGASSAIAAGGASRGGNTEGLEGNAQVIANFLLAHDVDAVHTAAILGNMYQESGYSTTSLNPSSGAYGICQWTDGRKASMQALAASKGVPDSDINAQLEWFLKEYNFEPGATGGWLIGSYGETFKGMTDLDDLVEFFARRFERCGEGEMNLQRRLDEAHRVYTALTSGGGSGQEYSASSEVQKAIVDSAHRTPTTGGGYCAGWVSNVYANAGLGYVGGNACCMYLNYCHSSNRSELKVGMLVAVQESPTSYGIWNNGHTGYGHVGIYIGDGNVISNAGGPIVTQSLDSFISTYGTRSQVRWGFPPNVNL